MSRFHDRIETTVSTGDGFLLLTFNCFAQWLEANVALQLFYSIVFVQFGSRLCHCFFQK